MRTWVQTFSWIDLKFVEGYAMEPPKSDCAHGYTLRNTIGFLSPTTVRCESQTRLDFPRRGGRRRISDAFLPVNWFPWFCARKYHLPKGGMLVYINV